jgi:hypothetical protein
MDETRSAVDATTDGSIAVKSGKRGLPAIPRRDPIG